MKGLKAIPVVVDPNRGPSPELSTLDIYTVLSMQGRGGFVYFAPLSPSAGRIRTFRQTSAGDAGTMREISMLKTAGTLVSITAYALLAMSGSAAAHLGHLGELAGHSHWSGAAALAGAVIAAGILAVKGRKKSAKTPKSADPAPSSTQPTAEGTPA